MALFQKKFCTMKVFQKLNYITGLNLPRLTKSLKNHKVYFRLKNKIKSEREGIEPTTSVLKTTILPLNYPS